MAEGERCAASAAEITEDFEIVDKKQVPKASELKEEGKGKAEEARWSAPILSLAKKASENLALGYGTALKSASLLALGKHPYSWVEQPCRFYGTGLLALNHVIKPASDIEESMSCLAEKAGAANLKNTNQERLAVLKDQERASR